MSEPATLEPISYERVVNDAGQTVGWQVPKSERRRYTQGHGYPAGRLPHEQGDYESRDARPFAELRDELDAEGIGSEHLYRQLEAMHSSSPAAADRLVRATIEGAQRRSLHDPSAFLASRLRSGK